LIRSLPYRGRVQRRRCHTRAANARSHWRPAREVR
jgi:hypothetical protein